jgi:Zn-dependent peptidase ImmA (M78 family)
MDDLNHSKVENKALKYAVDIMIPTNDLLFLILNNNAINIYEISEYFEVTEDFIMLKFYYMSLDKTYYTLNDDKSLVLSSYPSIFIYYGRSF